MKLKRVLALIMSILLIFPVLIACSKDEEKTDTSNVSTKTDDIFGLEIKEFENQTFKVLDANDYPEMHINFSENASQSTIEQKLFERDMLVEEMLKVDISYVQINNRENNGQGIQSYKTSYDAGDMLYDMIISTASGNGLMTLAQSGYLANLNDTPTVSESLQENWWSKLVYQALNLNGVIYFTTGDIAASVYDAPAVVFANKKLIEDNGISDNLYDKVEAGEWTFEYLGKITADYTQDLDEDGLDFYDDQFGIINLRTELSTNALLVGMGLDMAYISADEKIILNDDIDLIDNLATEIRRTMKLPTVNNGFMDPAKGQIQKMFCENKAMFLMHFVESANNNLKTMQDDFIILPMPKASVEQTEYRSLVSGWVDCFVGVPKYVLSENSYADRVGYIIEALARTSYNTVRPIVFEEIYKLRNVRDARSSEMLDIVYNSLYADFHTIADFGYLSRDVYAEHVFGITDTFIGKFTSKIGMAKREATSISEAWVNNSQ